MSAFAPTVQRWILVAEHLHADRLVQRGGQLHHAAAEVRQAGVGVGAAQGRRGVGHSRLAPTRRSGCELAPCLGLALLHLKDEPPLDEGIVVGALEVHGRAPVVGVRRALDRAEEKVEGVGDGGVAAARSAAPVVLQPGEGLRPQLLARRAEEEPGILPRDVLRRQARVLGHGRPDRFVQIVSKPLRICAMSSALV